MTENHVLTDAALKKLTPGDHPDGLVPGLVFRVRETGGRSWALRYRVGARLRRLTLGSYPALKLVDARTAARAARKIVARGEDPATAKKQKREADTFGELAERYIEQWAKPRKRTWKADRYLLDAHVLPVWRHLPAKEITRRNVRELLEKAAGRGAVGANRVRALLSKLFNFGISIDVVEHNPVVGTLRNPENTRDRVLSDGEIRKLWEATKPPATEEDEDLMPLPAGARWRLQLATAQRAGEVNAMKWADLDLGSGMWTIPAERSKNGLAHRVPLSPLALEILSALPREGEYVLAGGRGKRRHWETKKEIPIKNFRGHDLRRTAASSMASLGVPRLVIGKVLNHVERGITAVYDRHSYDLEKRDALNRWSAKLRSILEGESARVVEFRR